MWHPNIKEPPQEPLQVNILSILEALQDKFPSVAKKIEKYLSTFVVL